MNRFRVARGAFLLLKDAAKHVLRHPVVGIAAAGHTADGRWLLVRRADTGEWALPGGTLEWGETLRDCLVREMREETGVERCDVGPLVGVFSRPGRDPRFHGVTVVVRCRIDAPVRPPVNPLEILEARLFSREELPKTLAMGMEEMLSIALVDGAPVLE
jgi:8-oxo-dGTP diphosphatase